MTQDQLQQSQQATSRQGNLGEQFALAFERKRLPEFLHGQIVHFKEHEIALGYDILSFETRTSILPDRYIEVKTFRGHPHFYWTDNEIAAARKYAEHYYLYLIDIDRITDPGYEPQIIPNPAVLFDEPQVSEERTRFNAPSSNSSQNGRPWPSHPSTEANPHPDTPANVQTWPFHPVQYAFSLNAETNIPKDWDTSTILLGCYNNEQHLRWILAHNLYNVRAERPTNSLQKSLQKVSRVPGSIALSPMVNSARYLVLYSAGTPRCYKIFELTPSPFQASRQHLINLAYPNPHCPNYVLHPIARQLPSFHIDLPQLLRIANPKDTTFVCTPLYLAGIQLRQFMDVDSQGSPLHNASCRLTPFSISTPSASVETSFEDQFQTLSQLLSVTPDSLSETEISKILDILPALEKWSTEFKQQAIGYASSTGVALPGYQLKEFHWRTILDKSAVIESIQLYDPTLASESLRPRELRSLADLEQVLGHPPALHHRQPSYPRLPQGFLPFPWHHPRAQAHPHP